MSQFDNVSVLKQANVYFDGKCVSHTIVLADGVKKSVGVVLPSTLTFNTGAPEIMETVAGSVRYRLKGESGWKVAKAGEKFSIPGNSSFDIEVTDEPYHYVCHFG
jgi:purine/pyrimidine-nucleoside phosphorylase